MMQNLRAISWLTFLTLLLCSVLYPLTLWAIAQTPFLRHQAEGSLLRDADQKPAGSRLIAQAFNGDEYFQPRPSATGGSPYNAMASGGSNLAANNPKLRGRVAQQLGPIVRYVSLDGPGKGPLVGEDIEKWFQSSNGAKPRNLTAEWAATYSSLVGGWATSSDLIGDYIKAWANEHPGVLQAWKAKNPDASDEPKPDDLAPFFFDDAVADSFVKLHPGMWPSTIEEEKGGKKVKAIKPDNKGDDIRAIFFDMWLQEHPDAKLEPVPADMVMTSASGLDPHITLKNAQYQLDRVAGKWAEKAGLKEAVARQEIESILRDHAAAPLGGLVGVPLINVLEVNLALSATMKRLVKP